MPGVHSDVIMPLEQGEVTPMRSDTAVLFGDQQLQLIVYRC
nr:hypothetical protein [Mycobacterium sp.]